MRTVTVAFQTELDKKIGAKPRTLLEIDAVGGTLYYSDQTVTGLVELGLGNVFWTANLISVWHLNSDLDDTKGSNDGTGTNFSYDTVNQKLGSAAGILNGIDGYASIPDNDSLDFDYNEDFTVKIEVKIPATQLDTSGDSNNIIRKVNAGAQPYPYAIKVFNQTAGGNAGKITVFRYDGTNIPTIISTSTYNDDQWHQIIFTKNGSVLSLYIDGQFDKSTTDTTTTTTTNSSPLFFGRWGQASGWFFKGALDEVAIWDRGFSASEAATLYDAAYSSKVLEFGKLVSQIVPGEEVVRVASMNFRLSNIDPIDDLIVAGTEIRVYDWFEGLAVVDKAIRFKGNVSGKPAWDDREISFTAYDIFQKFNKTIGRPLLKADWALADPDYYGFTIPILIGTGENLECLPIEAGAASTLRADFNPADTTIKLTSTTSPLVFPSSGTVIIGNETYTYTGISSNDLTGVPVHSDLIYQEGSVVLEQTNLKFLAGESFSDTPVKALTNLRILPFNSKKIAEAVAIDSAFYTINLTETISSKVYATIVLTQINAIRKAVSLAVTTQPNQPITTQQTQVSPAHGHTPSNQTVAYFFDSVPIKPGTHSNPGRLVNTELVDEASGLFFDNDLFKVQKSVIQELDGTPVSAILKMNARETAGLVGKVNMKFVLNGVTKIDQQKSLNATLTTYSTSSFSLSGANWSDFQNANTYIELKRTDGIGGSITIYFGETWLELTYTPANPTTAVTVNESIASVSNRIVDTVIGGDTVADTLLGRLICDFEGCKDKTDGHYTGTPSTQPLIEKPPDVTHFLWENFSNDAVHADLDISGSFLDARNNLPASYKYGFALIWQSDLTKLSAQLAQMAHCRFFTSAALAKFARILDSGTPVKVIDTDDYSPLTEDQEKKLRIRRFGGAIEEIINKVEIKYKHNPALGSRNNPDAYASNSESTDAAAAASISTYGERRRRTPWLMWAVRDDTMAADLRDKLLTRYKYPRTTTVFPSWSALALLEQSDLIDLTSQKLRIDGKSSEIMIIGNNPQVPKNFQPTEIMITVRDLGIYLETLSLIMTSTISGEDFQTYIESLLTTVSATISVTDYQTYVETLTTTITGTVSITDTRYVNTFWCGATGDKLYLTSGQFTSTLKDSEDVNGVDNEPQGISYDGTNTPWCGNQANKLYLQSGQFTSTLKTSEDVSAVDTSPQGISWDGTNTPWCGFGGKLYLTSGQFTSTIKDSEAVVGIGANARSISWDGTNTPWCNGSTGTDKLYLQSGQFTSTLKTSENINAVNIYSTGISYQTPNTLWSGNLPDKLYLQSGQFTSTIKTSQSISGIDSWCTDIDTSAIDLRF